MKKELTAAEIADGVALPSGERHELTVPSIVTGARPPLVFRRLRSFPGPSALGLLKRVVEKLTLNPFAEAVLVGHSDSFGDGDSNEVLSKSRARATAALLAGDAEFLVAQFTLADENQRWGTMEAIDMMTTRDPDDFPIAGDAEADEIGQFQGSRGLPKTGLLDGATIRAAVDQYVSLLGAARPKPGRLHALGGGSAQPILPLGSDQQVSDDPESPQFVHPRRVEIFIFEGLIFPDVATFSEGSSSLEPSYEQWCKRCKQVLEAQTGALRIRVTDQQDRPIVGRKVDLLEASASNDVNVLASTTTDPAGVARFPDRLGAFTARVASVFDEEVLVRAQVGLPNVYELSLFESGVGGS